MGSQLTDAWRKKYPGEYDDLSDEDLEKGILAKYPEYKDLATPPKTESKSEPDTQPPADTPGPKNYGYGNRWNEEKQDDLATNPLRAARSAYDRVSDVGNFFTKPLIPQLEKAGEYLGSKITPTGSGEDMAPASSLADKGFWSDLASGLVEHPSETMRGFYGGELHGLGKVASDFTSPINALPMALGAVPGEIPAIQAASRVAHVPMMLHGVHSVLNAQNPTDFASGLMEAILGYHGANAGHANPLEDGALDSGKRSSLDIRNNDDNGPSGGVGPYGPDQTNATPLSPDVIAGLRETLARVQAQGPDFKTESINPLESLPPDMVPRGSEEAYNDIRSNPLTSTLSPVEAARKLTEDAVDRLRGPRDLSRQNPLQTGPDVRDMAPKGRDLGPVAGNENPSIENETKNSKNDYQKIPLPNINDSTAVQLYKAAKGQSSSEITVPIDKLVATQKTFSPDVTEQYTNGTRGNDSLPQVMEHDGKYYISDGHHNILSQIQQGANEIKVESTPVDSTKLPDQNLKIKKVSEPKSEVNVKGNEPIQPAIQQISEAVNTATTPEQTAQAAQKFNQLGRLAGTETAKNSLWETAKDVANLPRAIMTSWDLSGPGRQGLPLALNKEYWTSFNDMFKSWGSHRAYQAVKDSIYSHPNFQPGVGGKSLAERADLRLGGNEEQFQSLLAEEFPGVLASERAYNAFLGKLRADTFNRLIDDYRAIGIDPANDDVLLRNIGKFINDATGRGTMGKNFEAALPVMSQFLFAPRLMASRINMYKTLLNPLTYASEDPIMRKQALKSLFAITGIGQTLGSLSKYAGASVNTDPTNPDFGKIKVGNTRIDPFAGFQQYATAAARIISGRSTSSSSGRVSDLDSGRFGRQTRADVAGKFLQSKLAPIPSFVWSMLTGKNWDGTSFDAKRAFAERMIPLATQDLYDIWKQDPKSFPAGTFAGAFPNVTKTALSIAPIVGFGSQTYGR